MGKLIDTFAWERREELGVIAWTGGSRPPAGLTRTNKHYKGLVSFLFQGQLVECGGLDLWNCAGGTSMGRARLFWGRAKYDAWATIRGGIGN